MGGATEICGWVTQQRCADGWRSRDVWIGDATEMGGTAEMCGWVVQQRCVDGWCNRDVWMGSTGLERNFWAIPTTNCNKLFFGTTG